MPRVVVYSRDSIRGRIVSKTLGLEGIRAAPRINHFEAWEAIHDHAPRVIIVDARKNIPGEKSFLATLSRRLPGSRLIVLISPGDGSDFEELALPNIRRVDDPFDPEALLSAVREDLTPPPPPVKKWTRHVAPLLSWSAARVLKTIPILVTLVIGVILGYLYWCIDTLPEIDDMAEYAPYEASRVFSSDNVLLTEFYVERRTFISLDRIPEHVRNAFIAVEDARFFEHNGIDIRRIIGALAANIKEGGYVQGGSTITQQLAKMRFLKPEKTLTRKIQEIALSLQIERRFSKEEVLALYLNQAYFGSRAYGLEAAAKVYFGKSAEMLTLPEGALLASLPKAPSTYSPFKAPQKAFIRRNLALKRMRIAGYIDEKTYLKYINEPMPKEPHRRAYKAPYFVEYCRPVLEKKYGGRIYTSGLKIYTTLDYRMQLIAKDAIRNGLAAMEERGVVGVQAALVAVDLNTGGVKAMVGGSDFEESQFNRAVQAKRQPGSAFKPVVYLTALNMGFKPDDMINDQKMVYKINHGRDRWTPRNYNHKYLTRTTIKKALAYSLNAATVNLSKKLGIQNIINTAKDLGIRGKIHPYYSSALGASEVTLLELVSAYAAMARGYAIEPVCFHRIIDKEKMAMVESSGVKERVIGESVSRDMREMLRAVILQGTGRRARELKGEVFGKTGTTNDYVDALFIGFNDNIAVGVWVGRDNHEPIGKNETGARAALPIWIEFMKASEGPPLMPMP